MFGALGLLLTLIYYNIIWRFSIMTGQIYLSLFILSLPLLLFIGRKTHFYYLDKKNGRR